MSPVLQNMSVQDYINSIAIIVEILPHLFDFGIMIVQISGIYGIILCLFVCIFIISYYCWNYYCFKKIKNTHKYQTNMHNHSNYGGNGFNTHNYGGGTHMQQQQQSYYHSNPYFTSQQNQQPSFHRNQPYFNNNNPYTNLKHRL